MGDFKEAAIQHRNLIGGHLEGWRVVKTAVLPQRATYAHEARNVAHQLMQIFSL